MRYHLDSSACVATLRLPHGEIPAVLNRWQMSDTAISSIVAAKLEVGVNKSTRSEVQRARLDFLFARLRVEPFDSEAARHYGEIRSNWESKDNLIGPLDLLIAAHARSVAATLITSNVREFRRVKGLKIALWR